MALRIAIAERDAVFAFEARVSLVICRVISLAMRDRNLDNLMTCVSTRVGGVVTLDAQMLHAADEMHFRIAHEYARQKPGLAGYLKAVADAENITAASRMRAHRIHDRRARG